MGSTGVYTGGGRLGENAIDNLRSALGNKRISEIGDRIVIYPNNYTGIEAIRKTINKWAKKLGLGSASRGYAIMVTRATAGEKERLINAINRNNNLTQNKDSAYDARVQKMLDKAMDIMRKAGRTSPMSELERRSIAELVRSTYQREQIDKIIANDRRNGNKLFGGHVKTRRLRKSDF